MLRTKVRVRVGGCRFYSTKVFVGDVEDYRFSELALEVLSDYARNCASDSPDDDDSLLIYAHMQWISSTKCKGVEEHMVAPSYCYTGQVGPRFATSWLLED